MARLNRRDDQWERIAHRLPGKPGDRGRTAADKRLFVEAVLWMARSGAPWRDLPETFGPWNSVYKRFARWQERGVWQRVFDALADDADFEEVFIPRCQDRCRLPLGGCVGGWGITDPGLCALRGQPERSPKGD
jgi:transposase